MKIARSQSELKADIDALRRQGKRIGFVPTMGALHHGHLSLVNEARKHSDAVVVSIFVNPTQFAPNEDFVSYPRQEEDDLAKLESVKVDLVYLPEVKDLYPQGALSDIKVTEKADILCGMSRPHFFHGVATVVKRLFEQVTPDVAVFGEKDFQQLYVIRWLVRTFNLPVRIIGAPIIREADGLAMSSRNAYLSAADRKIAAEIFAAGQKIKNKEMNIQEAKEHLTRKGFKVDYLEIRNEETLEPVTKPNEPARIFIAAYLGKTRLIDNIKI